MAEGMRRQVAAAENAAQSLATIKTILIVLSILIVLGIGVGIAALTS